MKKLISLPMLSFLMCVNIYAQTPEQEVQSTIETLFNGMRAGDSAMVASAFVRDAIMQTVARNRDGEVVKTQSELTGFLNSVGSPHDRVWDERIQNYVIKIDDELASVWTPYQFYIGDEFSHCGVNSFQLAKLEGEWKIIYIVDTRRRTNCVE